MIAIDDLATVLHEPCSHSYSDMDVQKIECQQLDLLVIIFILFH